ncbi:hypothetical protein ABZ871_09860 [Streptomyces populi]
MTEENTPRRQPRQLAELSSVHEFLDEIRLRPGVWLPDNSLEHLGFILIGYRAAMVVHDIDEDFDFWSPGTQGPFAEWLWQRLGRHSPLGWATEIEREARTVGTPAIELFFALFDEYRQERQPVEG